MRVRDGPPRGATQDRTTLPASGRTGPVRECHGRSRAVLTRTGDEGRLFRDDRSTVGGRGQESRGRPGTRPAERPAPDGDRLARHTGDVPCPGRRGRTADLTTTLGRRVPPLRARWTRATGPPKRSGGSRQSLSGAKSRVAPHGPLALNPAIASVAAVRSRTSNALPFNSMLSKTSSPATRPRPRTAQNQAGRDAGTPDCPMGKAPAKSGDLIR